MPITDLLERNSKLYGDEVALVEINPEVQEPLRVTWKEYDLIQPTSSKPYRREITWGVFDEKANRVANMLLSRGIKPGQKVAILLMNCLEWLPIYFGILKTGAIAVPLNFRYSSEEIEYCVNLADVDILFFGPEFTGRVENTVLALGEKCLLFFVGTNCPTFAESYNEAVNNCPSTAPKILVEDIDEAAIYFSSGTTGFPKAILHSHAALMQSARMEAIHHETTHEDVFLCIPPLYHTGAKMHWFGSLYTGSRAVILKGTSPKAILDVVSWEHCTIVWLLVPWCQDILTALDNGELKLEGRKLSQWRLMHIGAQPVPPSLIKHWLEYFPHHQYDTNYGLSESTGPGCVHLGMKNINKVTTYYISKIDGFSYFTPVTTISNSKKEKIEVIIEKLKTSPTYQTNLVSYLTASAELLNYEILENSVNLSFNNEILSLEEDKVIEEVKYSIALSVRDTYDVSKTIFYIDNMLIDVFFI